MKNFLKVSVFVAISSGFLFSCNREEIVSKVDNQSSSFKTSLNDSSVISKAPVNQAPQYETIAIIRSYNNDRRQHYYWNGTTVSSPLLEFNNPFYFHEGNLGNINISGIGVPVYASYNKTNRDQLLTTNPAGEITGSSWTTPIIIGRSGGNLAVYRYYSSNQNDHFYTTNFNELGGGNNSYVYEGIAFYIN